MFMYLTNKYAAITVGFCLMCCIGFTQTQSIYQTVNGKISFRSEAALELIKASSKELVGLLDNDKRTFSFKINMRSFEGFNSPLQKEHFHENYMESDKYPEASFKGKIIEEEDLTKDGEYEVRAKGVFTIHGVPQERIIKTNVSVKNKKITITGRFSVMLSDHNIPIPIVVYKKLANEIIVEVNAVLEPR
ncbi:hypothetical protein BH10BAC2_BH10BAC2_50100 [soil metagenome]